MDEARKQTFRRRGSIVLSGLIANWRAVVFSTVFIVLLFITFMLGVVLPAPVWAETIFATAVSVPAPFTNRLISFDSTTPGTIKKPT